MTHNCFMFLWNHIHIGEFTTEDIDSDKEKEDKEDDIEDLMEQIMERVQQDQEKEVLEMVDDKTVKDKATEKKLTKKQRCGSTSLHPSSNTYKKSALI